MSKHYRVRKSWNRFFFTFFPVKKLLLKANFQQIPLFLSEIYHIKMLVMLIRYHEVSNIFFLWAKSFFLEKWRGNYLNLFLAPRGLREKGH